MILHLSMQLWKINLLSLQHEQLRHLPTPQCHSPSRMSARYRSNTQLYQDNASCDSFGSSHAVVGRKLYGRSIPLGDQPSFDSIISSHNVNLREYHDYRL